MRQAELTASHWGAYEVERAADGAPTLRPHRADADPSPIGLAMLAAYRDGPRVLRPAVRRGWLERGPGAHTNRRGHEAFVEVDWEEAESLVSGELQRVIHQHGNRAVFAGSYGWASAGRFHHAQSQVRRFMHGMGGCTVHSQSYSYAAAQVLLPRVVAPMETLELHHTSWDVLARHTGLVVCFGGMPWKNAQVGVGGAFEHRLQGGLRQLAQAGCRFVNFSPVRDDLAVPGGAVEWIAVRPGTDTAVMLALACEIVRAGLHDTDFLARHCTGFETWRAHLLGQDDGIVKDADWAGALSGVCAERLRVLAREMTARDGRRCLVNAALALQRADHGEQPYWALVSLAAVIGQIGLPGGGFGVGYGCENGPGSPHGLLPSGPRLPFGPNPIAHQASTSIPVARIADMLLQPGQAYRFDGEERTYPDIRLVYWAGGNPFHHHQDINRLRRAWQRPETIVVHEQVWNAHARHADIVLPATSTLEREDIGFAYREPRVVAMKAVLPPPCQARDDHAIFAGLAARLGFGDSFTEGRTPAQWQALLWRGWRQDLAALGIEAPDYETFHAQGEWRIPDVPGAGAGSPVMLAAFRRNPEAHPLATPSGRIEIFSAAIAGFTLADCPPHASWLPPAEWLGSAQTALHPLHLITDQPAARLHSQLDFSAHSRATKVQGREPLWLHPDAACARGIAAGDVVRVFNARGACLAGAVLTEGLHPQVVKLSTGAWYDPTDDSAQALCKHGSANVLTRDAGTSALAQGSVAQSCLVQVERWRGPLPPVTAFERPAFVDRAAGAPH